MTIHFVAANARTTSLTKLVVGPVAGFLGLWFVVTVFVRRAPFHRPQVA